MLLADVIFNCGLAPATGLTIFLIIRMSNPHFQMRKTFWILACFGLVALALASMEQYWFGYRHFAMLRFTGMAIFWHLPLVLIIVAVWFRRSVVALPGVLLILAYFYAYHIEPHRLEVTHYQFTHPLLQGLQYPVRIAQISDIQTDEVGEFEKKVFEAIAGENPDLIFYTGDYVHCVDPNLYKSQLILMNQLLQDANLHPALGSFAVRGDADIPRIWRQLFANTSVRILENETVRLQLPGIEVDLTGIEADLSRARTPQELANSMKRSSSGGLHFFIGHSPDFVTALTDPFVVFSGHTHGGQVQLPFFGPLMTLSRLPRKYADYYGPYNSGTLSVCRGIGMERYDAPRLRFLCRPEIRIITLTPR